jgi:RND family efflux transporter MFP subunit
MTLVGFFSLGNVVATIQNPVAATSAPKGKAQPLFGGIDKPKTLKVPSAANGIVAKINVKQGDKVKAGDVLVQLDDAMAIEEVARAKAQVELAKAELLVSKARKFHTQLDFERANALQKQKAISQAEFDMYRFAAEIAVANERAKEAALRVAEATLKIDMLRLNQCRIVAPAAGTVLRVNKQVGEAVAERETVVEISVAH